MKKIFIFVPIFLIALIIISSVSPVISKSEDISNNVFRLHIIANSDTEKDQTLKLKIRDNVLRLTSELYNNCNSVDDAVSVTKENIVLFRQAAQSIIAFYGYTYDTKVTVTKEYFNTRKYDNFTLPAGVYDSLKIIIGEGKGKNWWCVMFPSVCISGCTDDLRETLTEEEIEMLKSDKYIVRFKIVEIYEKLKSKIA